MVVVFALEQGITRRVLRGEGSPTTGDFTGFTNTADEWTYASAGGGQGRGGFHETPGMGGATPGMASTIGRPLPSPLAMATPMTVVHGATPSGGFTGGFTGRFDGGLTGGGPPAPPWSLPNESLVRAQTCEPWLERTVRAHGGEPPRVNGDGDTAGVNMNASSASSLQLVDATAWDSTIHPCMRTHPPPPSAPAGGDTSGMNFSHSTPHHNSHMMIGGSNANSLSSTAPVGPATNDRHAVRGYGAHYDDGGFSGSTTTSPLRAGSPLGGGGRRHLGHPSVMLSPLSSGMGAGAGMGAGMGGGRTMTSLLNDSNQYGLPESPSGKHLELWSKGGKDGDSPAPNGDGRNGGFASKRLPLLRAAHQARRTGVAVLPHEHGIGWGDLEEMCKHATTLASMGGGPEAKRESNLFNGGRAGNMGALAARRIAMMLCLPAAQRLRKLMLYGGSIGSKGVRAIAAVLCKAPDPVSTVNHQYSPKKKKGNNNSKMKSSGMGGLPRGVKGSLSTLLRPALTSLMIGPNLVGVEGAEALGEMLACPSLNLVDLYLEENKAVGNEGVLAIAAGLAKNKRLERLVLSGLQVTDAACEELGNATRDHPSLRTLGLARNGMTGWGLGALLGFDVNAAFLEDKFDNTQSDLARSIPKMRERLEELDKAMDEVRRSEGVYIIAPCMCVR